MVSHISIDRLFGFGVLAVNTLFNMYYMYNRYSCAWYIIHTLVYYVYVMASYSSYTLPYDADRRTDRQTDRVLIFRFMFKFRVYLH